MSKRDYYEILGIDKNANATEIKKAFRKKAMELHPDKNAGDKESEEKFKEVNEAYEILSDESKKDKYDRFGHAGVDPNASQGFGGAGFGGFEDIFGDIFSAFGGGGGSSRRRNGPRKGADIQQAVDLTFEEAAFGVDKEVSFYKYEECNTCDGTGAEEGTSKVQCPHCNGTGEVRSQQRTPFGSFVNVHTCDNCNGTGEVIEKPCKDCKGAGKTRNKVNINVKIPAGVDDESVINLRGQGEPGEHGGPPGNLYVVVQMESHKMFRRDGYDLVLEMPITFPQAVLGAELVVPTLDNKVTYKMAAGTQTGTVFRLKGKGIQYVNSSRKGDLYVKVAVEVPKKLSNEQKKKLKQFNEAMGGDGHEKQKSFFDGFKDILGL